MAPTKKRASTTTAKKEKKPKKSTVKMKRGTSRHVTLQKTLARCCKEGTLQDGTFYVASLARQLNTMIVNYDPTKLKVYSEVPFPGMPGKRKACRVDVIVYEPGRHFITVEFKTTETQPTSVAAAGKKKKNNINNNNNNNNHHPPQYQSYLQQIQRTTNNILRIVNYAASNPSVKYQYILGRDGDSSSSSSTGGGGGGPLFVSLLTVRNYRHGPGHYTDYTEQIGPAIRLPNLKYNLIIDRLYNKRILF